MKPWMLVVAGVLLLAGYAFTSPIHVWATGDKLNAEQINANFAHLHNTMVGGHGPRLTNGDINASAGISHSKLATPGLIPKAFAIVGNGTPCTTLPDAGASTCSLVESTGASVTVQHAGATTGVYLVTWGTSRPNTNYFAGAHAMGCAAAAPCYCQAYTFTASSFYVNCYRFDTQVLDDAVFSVVLYDKDN